ncbi:MAG: hypothetical protein JOY61_03545, partial [Chloroflexi bacterium]|nr:hypothetical protein [Chloroflexota bacterium]
MPDTAAYVERGNKRVFACAVDWPGWCRSGRDEAQALETLATYADRYRPVAQAAGLPFPKRIQFSVIDHIDGSGGTEFGVPSHATAADALTPSKAEVERLCAIVSASWKIFDEVVARAPASLRKGPRGGGRDRDAIVDHVIGAEATIYARKLGARIAQPAREDADAIRAAREIVLACLRGQREVETRGNMWPVRY